MNSKLEYEQECKFTFKIDEYTIEFPIENISIIEKEPGKVEIENLNNLLTKNKI